MANYRWNDALFHHFFQPAHVTQNVVLYLDRQTVEAIGAQSGLGTWSDFCEELCEIPHVAPNLRLPSYASPLKVAAEMCLRWQENDGFVGRDPIGKRSCPPIMMALALLVLGWTERPDHQENSYYKAVSQFVQQIAPNRHLPTGHQAKCFLQTIIVTLPKLTKWLKQQHDDRLGLLDEGHANQHYFVGAIQYHAFLSPATRKFLPWAWNACGFSPNSTIAPDRLAQRLLEIPRLSQRLPDLYRLLQTKKINHRKHVLSFLSAAFQRWDGTIEHIYVEPSIPSRLPRLKISFSQTKPDTIRLLHDHLPQVCSIQKSEATYQAIRQGDRNYGILSLPEASEPLKPDRHWMFDELRLETNLGSVHRPARTHFYLVPTSYLGGEGGGYIETDRLYPDTAFIVAAIDNDATTLLQWAKTSENAHLLSYKPYDEQILLVQGVHPQNQPFGKMPTSHTALPISKITFVGGKRLGDKNYRAELPPTILLQKATGAWLTVNVHEDPQGFIPLQLHPSNRFDTSDLEANLLPITACLTGHFLVSFYNDQGDLIDQSPLSLRPAEPLSPYPIENRAAIDQQGIRVNLSPSHRATHFSHNQLWGTPPSCPAIISRFVRTPLQGTVQPPSTLDLAHLILAASNAGILSESRFSQIVEQQIHTLGYPLLPLSEIKELRRQMESLGFLHRLFPGPNIQLSPLTLALLPDDCRTVRALIIGTMPWAIADFLATYTLRHDTHCAYDWITQIDPLIPPILEIQSHDLDHITNLISKVNESFPQAIRIPHLTPLSELILNWHTPLLSLDKMQEKDPVPLRNFPSTQEVWHLHKSTYLYTQDHSAFPYITRGRDPITGAWDCKWWPNPKLGFSVQHQEALPCLYAHHHIPYLYADAKRTDQVMFPGLPRLPSLIERALILCSGKLPELHQAQAYTNPNLLLDSTAPLRVFKGVKPRLRQQLLRIYTPCFPHSSPLNFQPLTTI